MSSAHSSAQLVEAILPESHRTIPTPFVDEAKASWASGHESKAPEDAAACNQRAWDSIRTKSTSQRLLDNAADEEERARRMVALEVTSHFSGVKSVATSLKLVATSLKSVVTSLKSVATSLKSVVTSLKLVATSLKSVACW